MNTFNFEPTLCLENDRVRLTLLSTAAYGSLATIALNEPALLTYSPSEIHKPPYLQNYIQTALNGYKNRERYPFLIFDKEKNQVAGCTSFGNIENKHQRLEIGWTWIGKKFQGTGLNKAAKYLQLSYAFEQLNFERVEFKIDGRNQASRRAVEKIGALHEGTLRSHTLLSDGFRRDTTYYAILKEEWAALKTTIFKNFR